MPRRGTRVTLLIILITTGLAAGLWTWSEYRRLGAALDGHRALDMRVDALLATVGDLSAAQHAYVIPGQSEGQWLARASALFQRLHVDVDAARAQALSLEDDEALDAFSERLEALGQVDDRAREYLRLAQGFMAADLLLTEGREILSSMNAALRGWQDRVRPRAASAAESFAARSAGAVAAAAILWVVGLLILFRDTRVLSSVSVSSHAAVTLPETNTAATPERPASLGFARDASLDPFQGQSFDVVQGRPLDLPGAAAVCRQLAGLTDAAALPAILAQAAEVLEATGIIIWLGAGDQLFAVLAHGYDASLVEKLGPVSRLADNVTAAAWRDAEVQTVRGNVMTNGALAAPIVGPSGSFGALAIEVRNGRESDPATLAVASIFAAQLAGLIAAWPAPSRRGAGGENPTSATA